MSPKMEYHKPVLLHQCIDLLQIREDGIYVDVTFGGGGHSREILKHLSTGRLYGFDQDPDARANVPDSPNFTLINSNFRHLKKSLRLHGVKEIDGLLADFGISSHQIDEPERGFSLRFEGPLDMRMNPDRELTAARVLNEYLDAELFRILKEYGEIKRPGAMVKAIVENRPLTTTQELKKVLERFAPPQKYGQFWAKIFQAIRIEVNEELVVIHELLEQATEILKPGGRLVCMSYHSLEDRPVKNFFRYGNVEGEPQKDFYGNLIRPLEPITRKPIVPDENEISENPRARSAKLRAAVKLEA